MSWEKDLEGRRKTGRTTRMLQAALAARMAGDAVIVLGNGDGHCGELSAAAAALDAGAAAGIKFLSYHSHGWMLTTPPQAGTKVSVFADHHAIECALVEELDELHRYDVDPGDETRQAG